MSVVSGLPRHLLARGGLNVRLFRSSCRCCVRQQITFAEIGRSWRYRKILPVLVPEQPRTWPQYHGPYEALPDRQRCTPTVRFSTDLDYWPLVVLEHPRTGALVQVASLVWRDRRQSQMLPKR